MEESESVVIARVRSGDGDAYRELVERHSRGLFRLAYRMTGNEQDAEDVVQETFLRAYRQLRRWEERSSFGTWLYRIAANYAMDLLRARRPLAGEDLAAMPSGGALPDRLLLSDQIQRRIEITLDGLSRQERAAFVLRHFDGQSIPEIGAALGVSGAAAKHSVYRAVQKLRQALEPLVNRGLEAESKAGGIRRGANPES